MEPILSAGIDVGTTTTQVVFSSLAVEDTAGFFSVPRVEIVDKRVIYRGEPRFTPMLDHARIDGEALRRMVSEEFDRAGVEPSRVGAGAVIVTGEAARKDNAQALAQSLAGLAGEFVVATAGPGLEAVIAGKGSGACEYSKERRCRAVNLDVGGGTTNAALFDNGETVSTGCIDVGGHLVRVDPAGAVTHISPAAARVAEAAGIPLAPGMRDKEALARLAGRMAELIGQMMGLSPRTELYGAVKTARSGEFDPRGPIDALFFSGGVADAVYNRLPPGDDYRFGDMGILLGRAIAGSAAAKAFRLVCPAETLRATVIGAGSYTTTVSGSTIAAEQGILPLRNLPVLRLEGADRDSLLQGDGGPLTERLAKAAGQHADGHLALALRGERDPSYTALAALAKSIAGAWEKALPGNAPVVVVLEEDIAKALGQLLRGQTTRPVLCIDGIRASAHDYIDIGRPVANGLAVPVVVKTLIFGR